MLLFTPNNRLAVVTVPEGFSFSHSTACRFLSDSGTDKSGPGIVIGGVLGSGTLVVASASGSGQFASTSGSDTMDISGLRMAAFE